MSERGTTTSATQQKMEAFIEALAELGSVRHAAEASGLERTFAYQLRATHEAFAARWKDALADSADVLEQEARRRAMEGHAEPVIYQGKLCYRMDIDGEMEKDTNGNAIPLTMRKFSDTLLMCLLNANNPEKFKYRAEVKTKFEKSEETPIEELSDAQLGDIVKRAGHALDELERQKAVEQGDAPEVSGPESDDPVH